MGDIGKNFSLEEFSPAKAEVMEVIAKSKKTDTTSLTAVHSTRIELRDTRVKITKEGKKLRDGALKFQKEIISREKELVALVIPEEERLSKIEEDAKLKIEMERRREDLPVRRTALESIGDGVKILEEDLLRMNDNEFDTYRLNRIDVKLTKDKEAYEAKKLEDERKAEDERLKKLKIDEAKVAKDQKKLEEEKERLAGIENIRIKKEEAERQATEKEEARVKAEKEKEVKRLGQEKFKKYLKSIGYNEDTDKISTEDDGDIKVWRLIGTYN